MILPMYCDLHTHSTASDGADPPEVLPRLAKEAGLSALALTDHDTTEGLQGCAKACGKHGIAFVPGIEVSADTHAVLPKRDPSLPQLGTLHILGLFVRHDDPKLADIHGRMKHARDTRNPAIVEKLRELGLRIEYREVQALAKEQGTHIIGRPHIATVLIEKGYVKSVQDAFRKYIGQGAPAYVRRDRLDPVEAIDAIHHAGGLAILAHAVQARCVDDDELEHFIASLKRMGLDGIETRHSDHPPEVVTKLTALAERLNLLTSGGSDYHGSRKAVALGSQRVPMSVYERLRERTG
ncbi:MAG: PHP domain-containing protein [Phycisphaera sp.]|nr:PHP domain-containing protein [Phycisphaera sp.]